MEQSVKDILADDFWIMPATPEYIDKGVPYITSKNIKNGTIDFSKVNYISQEDYEYISKNRPILVGDILISMIGTLGETAEVKETDGLFYGQNMFLVRIDESKVNKRYFLNFFKSNCVKRALKGKQNQSTQKYLKANHIEDLIIPVPDVTKQELIAKQLDKLTYIITLRTNELKQLDDLIKARFVEMFGNLRMNTKGWSVKTFDKLSYLITDGEHSTPRRITQGVYLLSARNILNHSLQLEDVDYIDKEEYERIAKRVVPQEGDVLISCSGTVGRCCSVPAGVKFQMVRSVALIRFKEEINHVFAEYMITSDYLQEQIKGSQTVSAQANLFQGKIKALKGFVPPIELQKQFADFVNQVDKSKLFSQRY